MNFWRARLSSLMGHQPTSTQHRLMQAHCLSHGLAQMTLFHFATKSISQGLIYLKLTMLTTFNLALSMSRWYSLWTFYGVNLIWLNSPTRCPKILLGLTSKLQLLRWSNQPYFWTLNPIFSNLNSHLITSMKVQETSWDILGFSTHQLQTLSRH